MNLEHAVQTIAKRGFTDRQARFLASLHATPASASCASIRASRASCLARRRGSSSPTSCGSGSSRLTTARTIGDAFITCVIGRSTRRSASLTADFAGRLACLAHSNGSCFWTPSWRTRTASGCRRAPKRSTTSRGAESRATIVRIGPSTKAINGSVGTSRIVCRSAFIHPATSSSFTCMQTALRDEFRDFLQRHAPLLERLPAWTVRIVVPPHLADVPDRLQKTAWAQLASPLSELLLTGARWYFDRRAARPGWLERPCRSAPL